MDWKSLVLSLSVIALSSNSKTRVLIPYVGPAIAATEDLVKTVPGESKAVRNARKLANAVALVKTGIATNNALQPDARDLDVAVSDHLIAAAISVVVDGANLIHKNPVLAAPALSAAAQ